MNEEPVMIVFAKCLLREYDLEVNPKINLRKLYDECVINFAKNKFNKDFICFRSYGWYDYVIIGSYPDIIFSSSDNSIIKKYECGMQITSIIGWITDNTNKMYQIKRKILELENNKKPCILSFLNLNKNTKTYSSVKNALNNLLERDRAVEDYLIIDCVGIWDTAVLCIVNNLAVYKENILFNRNIIVHSSSIILPEIVMGVKV